MTFKAAYLIAEKKKAQELAKKASSKQKTYRGGTMGRSKFQLKETKVTETVIIPDTVIAPVKKTGVVKKAEQPVTETVAPVRKTGLVKKAAVTHQPENVVKMEEKQMNNEINGELANLIRGIIKEEMAIAIEKHTAAQLEASMKLIEDPAFTAAMAGCFEQQTTTTTEKLKVAGNAVMDDVRVQANKAMDEIQVQLAKAQAGVITLSKSTWQWIKDNPYYTTGIVAGMVVLVAGIMYVWDAMHSDNQPMVAMAGMDSGMSSGMSGF